MEVRMDGDSATGTQKQEGDDSLWVTDGSVDLKGRAVLRRKTGCWKASRFIIGVEFCERLTYYCIASNLIIYLTSVMHQSTVYSAKCVNYWSGVSTVLPILGGFLADSYFGQYRMVLFSSFFYLSGLLLLTVSASLPSLKPYSDCGDAFSCEKATGAQMGLLLLALYLVAVGTSANKPSLQAFGADQFDGGDKTERIKKHSFFNWWYFGVCAGTLLAVTLVAYLQQSIVGSGWAYGGIPAIAMSVSVILFVSGTPFYRHKVPKGSPIKRVAQVFVASFRNRKLELPPDVTSLYEATSVEQGQTLLLHTDKFRFLDKAAIRIPPIFEEGELNPWKLCKVTQVEETKLLLRLLPVWLSCLPFGIAVAQGNTFFIKQATTMDNRIAGFEIPASSMLAFASIFGLLFIAIYDCCLVPFLRKITGNQRGITILQRIGIGMMFSILCMVSAAIIELVRIQRARRFGLLDSPKMKVPMSVMWLVPQFTLLGIADAFTLVGLQEFFYDQVPDSMRSLGIAFYLSVIGVSSFISGILINLVDSLSKTFGKHEWFLDNLNRSRLYDFYWILALLGALNLGCFIYVSKQFKYKRVKQVRLNESLFSSSAP